MARVITLKDNKFTAKLNKKQYLHFDIEKKKKKKKDIPSYSKALSHQLLFQEIIEK